MPQENLASERLIAATSAHEPCDEVAEPLPAPEGEYVTASARQVARTTGVSIEQQEVHLSRLRDGNLIEIREFHEKEEAPKAIGLPG